MHKNQAINKCLKVCKNQEDYTINERLFLNTYFQYIEKELYLNLERTKDILDHFLNAKIMFTEKDVDFSNKNIPICYFNNSSTYETEQLLEIQYDVYLYSVKEQYSSIRP